MGIKIYSDFILEKRKINNKLIDSLKKGDHVEYYWNDLSGTGYIKHQGEILHINTLRHLRGVIGNIQINTNNKDIFVHPQYIIRKLTEIEINAKKYNL